MIDFTLLSEPDVPEIGFSQSQLGEVIDYSSIASGNMIVDEDTKRVIEQVFLTMTGSFSEDETLSFGDRSWKIKVSPNLIKTSVVAAVMIGLLHASGASDFASLVLPAVLPMLIDIESIQLSLKDDLILSEMRLNDSIRGKQLDPQGIYDQLDSRTKKKFTFSEFIEVMDVLCLTGNLDRDKETGLFKLNDKKRLKFPLANLTIRSR